MAILTAGFNSCKTHKAISDSKNIYRAEGYTLVWSDEFNKEGALVTPNWRYEKGFLRNEEAQWYQQETQALKRDY